MDTQLSNEQLTLLQKTAEQGVLMTNLSNKDICHFLCSNGFITFWQVLVIPPDSFTPADPSLTLDLDSSAFIVQLTEKGKAYIHMHSSKKKATNIELIISICALVSSITLGILGLFF